MPDTDELQREAKKIARDERERAELFATLMRNIAFQKYRETLNAMINVRMGGVLDPIKNSLQQLEAEHNKGAVYGLILARDLVEVTVNAMQKSSPAEENE